MSYKGTAVYIGIKGDMCFLTHRDERGKPISTEITTTAARNYLENGMKGLLPVLVVPYSTPFGYNPLTKGQFDAYFNGIENVSYSRVSPEAIVARKEKQRQRGGKNKKEAKKRRAKKSKTGRKARGWTKPK